MVATAFVLMVAAFLAPQAEPAQADPVAYSLGTISAPQAVGDSQCPAGATCSKFTISSCPDGLGGVVKAKTGFYADRGATGTPKGMVVLFSGGSGTFYWSSDNAASEGFVQNLRSDGFRVIEVRWNGAWEAAESGQQAGPARTACRPATVIHYLGSQVFPTMGLARVEGRCGFCIAGTSGGSAATSYALSFYGLEGLVDGLFPIGGPTHAAIRLGCTAPRGYEAYSYSGASIQQVDRPYGYLTSGTGPCSMGDSSPAWAARWDQDAVDGTLGSDFAYDHTRVHVIVGGGDTPMQNHASDYLARLAASGSPYVTYQQIPGMPHGISQNPDGLAAFRSALNLSDAAKFAACGNGIDDDGDGLKDAGPDPGCTSATDASERSIGSSTAQCDNGANDDFDSRRDYPSDSGCTSPTDTLETSAAACDDGLDNNGDGKRDYPADLECAGATDTSEGQAQTSFTLTVTSPSNGRVTSAPAGIDCPGDCSEAYVSGTSVVLTASPAAGYVFSSWTGDCAGQSGATCTLSMTANRTAGATFAAQPANTLTVSSPTNGRVTSSPAGIDCPGDCSQSYSSGQAVTLTATPAAGYAFSSWGGDCAGQSGPTCSLTMSSSRAASVQFVATQGSVTVTKAGTGQGTVTSSPAGISCNASCSAQSASFANGTSVQLTASPASGSTFVAWGGDCTGTASTCVVTATGSRNVTARFDQVGGAVATVTVSDSAFTPKTLTVAHGDSVKWMFQGSRSHRVQDNRSLGNSGSTPTVWFDSGPKSPGESFTYAFCAAGLFPYHSPSEPVVMTGSVSVQMRTSSASGSPSSTFSLSWACGAMAGFRFEVEYRHKAPGATTWGAWQTWKTNEALPSGAFVPTSLKGAGSYQFHSKLENATTNVQSDWSPFLSITAA
jgi:uncharacterized repeat protein (TIGR02543 family)